MLPSILILLTYAVIIVVSWFLLRGAVLQEMGLPKGSKMPFWIYVSVVVTAISIPGVLVGFASMVLTFVSWIFV
jgi:hypothetical protein